MASELCLYRVRKQGGNDMKMQSVKVRLNTPPEMCGTVLIRVGFCPNLN